MRRLESLDAWRTSQELAAAAYQLTMQPAWQRHFALCDQVRRAALSVPANIAEGYALSSTPQFIRCLRISLGSAAELRSHLEVASRLTLGSPNELRDAIAMNSRVIAILVGLLRTLSRRGSSRFPFPASRFPIKAPPHPEEAS